MMRKKGAIWIYSLSIAALLFVASNCDKDVDVQLPSVTTTAVGSITSASAMSGGIITSDGGSAVTGAGICWSTTPSPVISSSKTSDGAAGTFSSNMGGLLGNTTYYVRAYATNISGTGYGNELSFTTLVDAVTIGTQTWMHKNLEVTKYQNGDPIMNIIDGNQWINLTQGAYSDYDNSTPNNNTYGHLYNWYAVTDSRKLCPSGWHVSTNDDWQTLADYLGGLSLAGGKMKEPGTTHWQQPNSGATDQSGFSALPGGHRYVDGGFYNLKIAGYWWTSTEVSASNSNYALISTNGPGASLGSFPKVGGFSVRCVRD
jgi:uncharacterized protein (TIGR02145 family)